MTSLPIPFRWPITTLSFFVPERNCMTHLHQKLNQLTLTTMSRQLDQIASDAGSSELELFASSGIARGSGTGIPQPERHRAPLPPVTPPSAPFHRRLQLQTSQEPHGD